MATIIGNNMRLVHLKRRPKGDFHLMWTKNGSQKQGLSAHVRHGQFTKYTGSYPYKHGYFCDSILNLQRVQFLCPKWPLSKWAGLIWPLTWADPMGFCDQFFQQRFQECHMRALYYFGLVVYSLRFADLSPLSAISWRFLRSILHFSESILSGFFL